MKKRKKSLKNSFDEEVRIKSLHKILIPLLSEYVYWPFKASVFNVKIRNYGFDEFKPECALQKHAKLLGSKPDHFIYFFEVIIHAFLFLVRPPLLRLQDEDASCVQRVINLLEQSFDARVPPVQMNPFGCGQAKNRIKFFVCLGILNEVFNPE